MSCDTILPFIFLALQLIILLLCALSTVIRMKLNVTPADNSFKVHYCHAPDRPAAFPRVWQNKAQECVILPEEMGRAEDRISSAVESQSQ